MPVTRSDFTWKRFRLEVDMDASGSILTVTAQAHAQYNGYGAVKESVSLRLSPESNIFSDGLFDRVKPLLDAELEKKIVPPAPNAAPGAPVI